MMLTLRGLVALVGLVAIGAPLALADPVFPKASSVGLEPPSGMAVADGFLGYQEGPASILIIEMPKQAYGQINSRRTQFEAQLQSGASEDFTTTAGLKGFIVRGRQQAAGHSFRKWVVVLDAPAETAMVTAQIPVDDSDIDDAAVEASLKTILVRTRPSLSQQIDALPYRVGDLAGFRATATLAGDELMLTDGPKDVDPEAVEPHVVIGTNVRAPTGPDDRVAVAKAILGSVTAVSVEQVKAINAFDAGGAHWVNFEGTGTTGRHRVPVDVSFYIRFGGGGSIVVYGFAPPSATGNYAARFRQIALSVTPKG